MPEKTSSPFPSSSERKKAALCPLCGQDRVEKWRPFCSPKCRDLDLFRWLNGRYVISSHLESSSSEHQENDQPSEELRQDQMAHLTTHETNE